MEKLETEERKILRKILGPIKENEEYRRRHNKELYKHLPKITDEMRKRRIAFYGNLGRMNPERLTNRMLRYFLGKKTKATWFLEIEKDLNELGITQKHLKRLESLKEKLKDKSFREKPKMKTGKA